MTKGRDAGVNPREGLLKKLKPDRIIYPHEKLREKDIDLYYRLIAPRLLPHIIRRPLTLVLCPNNIKVCRYKKHATRLPAEVRRIDIPGHREKYIMIDSIDGLLALVEVGMVEIHGWGSRWDRIDYPDKLVFDLDPDEGVSWEALAEAVLLVRNFLLDLGLESFLKTSGGKGYHVVVPILPEKQWTVATPFTRMVAERLAAQYPARLTSSQRRDQSDGKIFIDWIRNGRGTNAIEPWSLRARHGAPIATPIDWAELVQGLRPDAVNLLNIGRRLESLTEDPWADYFTIRQVIPA